MTRQSLKGHQGEPNFYEIAKKFPLSRLPDTALKVNYATHEQISRVSLCSANTQAPWQNEEQPYAKWQCQDAERSASLPVCGLLPILKTKNNLKRNGNVKVPKDILLIMLDIATATLPMLLAALLSSQQRQCTSVFS